MFPPLLLIGQSRAVSAYIGQQGISACVSEAVLSGLRGFFPLWPLFQGQVQIPLADVNIDTGQGKFPSPASPSRGLSVHVPRRCVPGIYKHGLLHLKIFSRLCYETKGFLWQEKYKVLQIGKGGQVGLILWANSKLHPLTQLQTSSLSTSEFRHSMQIIWFGLYSWKARAFWIAYLHCRFALQFYS